MTATNANNIVLSQVGLTKGGVSITNPITVTLGLPNNDEEILSKTITLIPNPKPTKNQETDTTDSNYGPNDNRIVDILLKVDERISFDSYLVSNLSASDSNSDCESAKSDLKKLFLGGGVINMTYEGSTFTVAIERLSIRRVSTDGVQAPDGVIGFNVKMVVVKGVDF